MYKRVGKNMIMRLIRPITKNRQIGIPVGVRRELDLEPGDRVEVVIRRADDVSDEEFIEEVSRNDHWYPDEEVEA